MTRPVNVVAAVLLLSALAGCLSSGFHPVKATKSVFERVKEAVAGPSPAPIPSSAAPVSTRAAALPALPSPAKLIPPAVMKTIAPVLASPAAPAVLFTAIHWLYLAALLCFLLAGLAVWRAHILAAVKFAFAGAAGLVIGKVFGVVIGSFVLACFASFAVGVVVAWWIVAGRANYSGFNLEAWFNARASLAAEQVAKMVKAAPPPS